MGVFLNSLHREILKKLSEKRLVSFKEPFKELVSLECLSGKEFAYIKKLFAMLILLEMIILLYFLNILINLALNIKFKFKRDMKIEQLQKEFKDILLK